MTQARARILTRFKSVTLRIALLLPISLALGLTQAPTAWAKPPISQYIDYNTFEFLVRKCTWALRDVNQVIGNDPNLFFGGGGLRGVIGYIYNSVEKRIPASSLCNKFIGNVENFTQHGADKDLYVRPGYQHVGNKGGWDILSAEFAAASREAGGTAIEKVQVRPDEIVDPFGALHSYYNGELKYIDVPESQFAKFRQSSGNAGLSSNRKTALLLRWLRFAADLPGVTLTQDQIKMANKILTDEILNGQIEPGNYWVAKALKKNFTSHGVHHFDNWKDLFTTIPLGCYLGDLGYFVVNGHHNVPLAKLFPAEDCAEARVKLYTEALRKDIPDYQIADHRISVPDSAARVVSDETARAYLKEVAKAAPQLTDHPNPGMLPAATYTSHPLTTALIRKLSAHQTPENLAVIKELRPIYQRMLENPMPGTAEALGFDVLRALDLVDEKTLEKWTSGPLFIYSDRADEKLELLHKKNPEAARAVIRKILEGKISSDAAWIPFSRILSKPESPLAKDLGSELNRNFDIFFDHIAPEHNIGQGALNVLVSAKKMISEENQKKFAVHVAKSFAATNSSTNTEIMNLMLNLVLNDQPQMLDFLAPEDLKRLVDKHFKTDAAINDLKRFANADRRPPTITSLYTMDPDFVNYLQYGNTKHPKLIPYFAQAKEELYQAVTQFMHSPNVSSEEAWHLVRSCKVLRLFQGAEHDLLKEYASRFGTLDHFISNRDFFDWDAREQFPSAREYFRQNLNAHPEFFEGPTTEAKLPFEDLKRLLGFWSLSDEFEVITKGYGNKKTIQVLPKEDSWKRTLYKTICKPAEKQLTHSK
ncbi:MAG: hypothetical protein ACJ763_08295 [Bdellovibrionia bacterium]